MKAVTMNGHTGSNSGACSQQGEEMECAGHSESEFALLEGHLGVLDDDFEQPDGQRSSLSLDDDGGTHFEPHSQETIIRRCLPLHDLNTVSSSSHEGSDDNDVVFNPVQRLHFDYEGEEDDDDGIEDSLEVAQAASAEKNIVGIRDCIPHRPGVNGAEIEAYCGNRAAQDQGQNVRIIEGHDSSIIDDGGNSTFGFNFLQTQMIHIPVMSPVNMSSGMGNGSRMDDEAHNMYDSLEREDGASLYEETGDNEIENSTTEYFRTGSMSLVVANSQVSDCDSLWAQDDSSEHESYIPHSQQHFQSGLVSERNVSRHQSPPRNFQADVGSMFVPKRREGFLCEGNLGGYGDVHTTEEDNTDALTLELSEEGLTHATQMYAQPLATGNMLSSLGNNACKGDMGTFQQTNNWTNPRQSAQSVNQFLDNVSSKSVPHGASNSQPKNLVWNQGLIKDDSIECTYVEGDGVDTRSDERLVGACAFLVASQKPTSDSNQSARKPAGAKVQTRRPAVQGSASSGNTKRSGITNSRQGSVAPRKPKALAKSGSHNDAAGRGSSNQNNAAEQSKGYGAGPASSCDLQSRAPQGHTSNFSMTSRSSSHTSLASNVSSTNSRVGGVGKESHMSTHPQASSSRVVIPQTIQHEKNHLPMTMAQRLAGSKAHASSHLTQASQQQQQQYSHQILNSSDSISPTVSSQPELHKPQSHTKLYSSCHHSQGSSPASDQLSELHKLTYSHHMSEYNHQSGGYNHQSGGYNHQSGGYNHQSGISSPGSRNPQNKSQHHQYSQQGHPGEYRSYGGQQMAPQISQTRGLSGPECNKHNGGDIVQGNHCVGIRDTVVSQMETQKRQGHSISPCEVSSQPSQLDNDLVDMEEVRGHLHRMLNVQVELSHSVNDHMGGPAELLSDQSLSRPAYFDVDASLFIVNSHQDDMSDIFENFPAFSSKMFSDMPGMSSRSDPMNQGESQYLRDNLEKERYRRKHCEEHIQKQNAKLLEIQQQLAVAVSTDKRKDVMIEQLDKQLAKVVEGWKKREIEKDELLKVLGQEKENMEECLQNKQTVISSLEQQLSKVTQELTEEKNKSTHIINSLKKEVCDVCSEKEHIEQILRTEKEENAAMKAEWDALKENKERAEKKAQQVQETLRKEQEDWNKKKQELSFKINEHLETSQRTLNMEKVKFEEQKTKREQAETLNEKMKTELKKAVQDMEQLIREKESQKVEMAIMEAKFESSQQKLEADLHSQMEKQIADQTAEFHLRIETCLEEAGSRHIKQVAELQEKHKSDLEEQAALLNEERQKKEDEYRTQVNELEEKLQELRSENLSLAQSKIKLESQRMEILTKLQFMMQSQWNEAVSLLVTTPQKKSLNSSFLSTQSGSAMANVGSNMSAVSSLSLTNSGVPALHNQVNEDQGQQTSGSSSKTQIAAANTNFENETDQRHEEIDRMDRVEEYLLRLPHNMDIPLLRNDISLARNQLQSSGSKLRDCSEGTSVLSLNNNTSIGYCANAVLQRHLSVPTGLVQVSAAEDPRIKMTNNLGHAFQPAQPHGYVTGSGVKSSMTSESENLSSTSRANNPGNHQMFNYPSHQSYLPPQLQHSYHIRQHLDERPQSSPPRHYPTQGMASVTENTEMLALTGNFGDHRQVKTVPGTDNINLYRPDSSAFTTGPTRMTPNHWCGSGMANPIVPMTSAGLSTSPGPGNATRPPLFSVESPVKKHRPRAIQHPGLLKESVSPPVKQRGEQEHSDDGSSNSCEGDRILAHCSHLSSNIMDEHRSRQGELQHYVRMLLQKAPGSVTSEPERDQQFSDPEILESSRDLTVDLDLNDTATAAELTTQLFRLQQLREREQHQMSKSVQTRNTKKPQLPIACESNESILSHLSDFIEDTDIISSQRLAEISNILNMYSNPDTSVNSIQAGLMFDAATTSAGPVHVSSENLSTKDDKRSVMAKSGKVKDLSKIRRLKIDSQATDSIDAVPFSMEAPTKPKSQEPFRKVGQFTEANKDKKKSVTVKQAGNKTTGGPAWK